MVPPIVDSSNGFVYAVAGTNDLSSVLLQASTTLSRQSSAQKSRRLANLKFRREPECPDFQHRLLFKRYLLQLGDTLLRLRLDRLLDLLYDVGFNTAAA